MAYFAPTLQVSPGLAGGLSTVILIPTKQLLSGAFVFAAEKGMSHMVDHTLAVETLHENMLSCCNPETRRYNVYFFVA